MCNGEGDVFIPLEDFIEFLGQYCPMAKEAGEFRFGRIRIEGGELVVAWAYDPHSPPEDWANKPRAVTDWEKPEA